MNNKLLLEKQIQQIELQLKRLNNCGSTNDVSEDLCNSLILQKAVLKKQLDDLNKNPIIDKIKKFIPHKEKLICDFFN